MAQLKREDLAFTRQLVLAIIFAIATSVPQESLAQSDLIRDVQDRLTTLGYDPGPLDGLMGPRTRAALRAFQGGSGLPETGEVDAQTLTALGLRQAVAPNAETSAAAPPKQPPPPREPQPSAAQSPTPPGSGATQAVAPNVETKALLPLTPKPSPLVEQPRVTQRPALSAPGATQGEGPETETTAAPPPKRKPAPTAEQRRVTQSPALSAGNLAQESGSRSASGAPLQTSAGPPDKAEPEIDFSYWWAAAIGLILFLLLRRRKRKAAVDSASGTVRVSVEYASRKPTAARRRAIPQNGDDFWVPPGKSVAVAGHDIGGMVYVGRSLRAERNGRAENCLVDPSLPVAKRHADTAGDHMPYWPSYSEIPPSSRLAYLRWLSAGRYDPKAELGYVFLYFYGLERRLFLDRPGDEEKAALIAEVRRLREIYGWNGSFKRYSRALLDAAVVLMHGTAGARPEPESFAEGAGWELPLALKLGLGREINEGRALDGTWLLCWWLAHPETRLRTPAKRAFEEFKSLFLIRFGAQYPDGLRLAKPKRRLAFTYRAASSTFERDFGRELADYPDVERLTKPVSIASGIAERCMDDLNAYSRYLGRKPDGRGTLEAHALLPDELAALLPNAELEALGNWADEQISETHGLVPVEAVLERLEGEVPERVGRRALIGAADALARVSVGLAPDPRFAIRAPKAGEPVVLFRLPGKIAKLEEVSPDYPGALLSVVLGTYVAHADGHVSQVERQRLESQIDRMTSLSDSERARLHANLAWFTTVPPQLGRLRKHFDALGTGQKQDIGRLAIAVAGADGVIDPAEVNAVQKLYRAMGLPEEQVFGDLHHMAAEPASEPVTVFRGGQPPEGFSIPEPPPEPHASGNGALRLDHARISSIMADTQRASQVLSQIFVEETAEDDPAPGEDEQDDAAPAFYAALDSPHRALVEELLTRPSWTDTEIGQLIGQFGLMVEGAIETVNEWAFDQFEDVLLDPDGDYLVNPAIVEALRSDRGSRSDDATQHQTA